MSKHNIRKYHREGNNKCPICNYQGKLVCHHINGRNIPNYDDTWNHAWICPNCHDLVHDNKIIVEMKQMGTIIWHHVNEESITGNDAKPYIY